MLEPGIFNPVSFFKKNGRAKKNLGPTYIGSDRVASPLVSGWVGLTHRVAPAQFFKKTLSVIFSKT